MKCHQCGEAKIPLELYQKHLEGCEMRRCGRCGLRVPEPEYQSHFDDCPFKKHSGCGARVLAHELEEHIESCPYHNCYKCFATKIHYSVFESHLLTCDRELCGGCNRRFLVADNHDCGQSMCNKCVEKMPTAEYSTHKALCSEQLYLKRLALEEDRCCGWLPSHKSEPCPNEPHESSGMCSEHAFRTAERTKNTAMEKLEFQKVLFADNTLLKSLPNFRNIDRAPAITKWMNTLDSSPKRIFYTDIEGNVNSSKAKSKQAKSYHTFQLTIRNGEGEIVVRECVIDHGHLTKEELNQRSGAARNIFVRGAFRKYYGEPSKEPATGRKGVRSCTWSQIAKQIELYIKKHGLPEPNPILALVDWSYHHVDFHAVKAGLTSVKKGHLLPADPVEGKKSKDFNPYVWWRVFRRVMGLVKGSEYGTLYLGLANIFVILYPGERRLAARAHDSGPDVKMLYRMVQFTRILWQEGRIDGRLGRHLTKRSVAEPTINLEALRKMEEDELLVISKEGDIELQEDDTDEPHGLVDEDESAACDYEGVVDE